MGSLSEVSPQDSAADIARPPAFSDEALALQFAERHANDLRFVAAWNRWLVWDGKRWRFDDTLHAFNLARLICREAAAECKTKASNLPGKPQDRCRGHVALARRQAHRRDGRAVGL